MKAAKTWMYPVNVPLRDYQFSIAQTALFSNTLVALPTGLGKTLIAAVVMYNYFRWFPGGKIVFSAPSRPLVMQQIEACHKVVGIPQEWTIDMTGQMNPQKRSSFWTAKRVFFVTPQVFEKDIQSGICPVKQLVCLVIDEAHRAMGNYSYCVAVRELMAVPVQLRILALTATPGSKQQTIQKVINNLYISKLEYRNESDHDVSKYVHGRKLELIEVCMTKDAVRINNLLLEAIQPFARRLHSLGLLRGGDFATLSPCELLNSRDRFRQAPPSNLPSAIHGEVEGYFGVLLTIYHVRKLLSSHGIRPAYEMLEEKLKQGMFARIMSRNENIWNAKLLMQRSLSHGAPNPKLEKMKELLVDHFEMQDHKDSRVIIFSNFRGSVRDIMDSLSDMGGVIKATEFIGQSSGRALKGQTQKIQQAVLQQFRAGGYNVIVATSIGEEGLDIMEVDLVICFDANISPLRMIQRMGRTGRKQDGRVVVLACEGSELKGYQRKQANTKAVRKHMHNGGTKSFDFHLSPRMVPHICKPQVQYVELSIEQFIPRERKFGNSLTHRSPLSKKMTKEEKGLIARYFRSPKEDTWKPSLIAFPSFQAFASRVHKVRHSSKTIGMLIDAMQSLQGSSSSNAKLELPCEVNMFSDQAHDDNYEKAFETSATVCPALSEAPEGVLQVKDPEPDKSSKEFSEGSDGCDMPKLYLPSQKTSVLHRFLFGEEFVTVNAHGDVLIPSLPFLSFTKDALCSKIIMMPKAFRPPNSILSAPQGRIDSSGLSCTDTEQVIASPCRNSDSNAKTPHGAHNILHRLPVSEENLKHLDNSAAEISAESRKPRSASQASKKTDALDDMERSPRLSHFVEKGIVPESPAVKSSHDPSKSAGLVDTGFMYDHEDCGLRYIPVNISENRKITDSISDSTRIVETPKNNNSSVPANDSPCTPKLFTLPSSSGVSTQNNNELKMAEKCTCETSKGKYHSLEPLIADTLIVDYKNGSCNEDWLSSCAEVSRSVHETPKYRRLRKQGDLAKKPPCKTLEEKFCSSVKKDQVKNVTGKQKDKKVKYFIEDEAEVSSDAEMSEDENDDKDDDAYDDSFIDDRTNSGDASTQAKDSRTDMMAFYRRSLLTQSPIAMESPLFPRTSANTSLSPRTAETGSCSSERIHESLQTPGSGFRCEDKSTDRNSVSYKVGSEKIDLLIVNGLTSKPEEEESKLESRKRKLSFQHFGLVSARNIQQGDQTTECVGTNSVHSRPNCTGMDRVLSFDDDFYEGLDLDAVEAQATKLLRYKSEFSVNQKPLPVSSSEIEEDPVRNSAAFPSFDLGIHSS